MKLRNLFLASVACAGLFTACSNGIDEVVNNVDGNEKEAYMQVGFAFPTTAGTRANTEEGLATEQAFEEIQLVITTAAGLITDNQILAKDKFSPEGTATDGKQSIYYSKGNIQVKAQKNAQVYVFVNPTANLKAITGTLDRAMIHTEARVLPEIAQPNKFLMSNKNGAAVVTNIEGTATAPTRVSVTVDRVVAKLQETSGMKMFDINYTMPNNASQALKITLKAFTYTNLNKNTYVLEKQEDGYTKDTNFEFGTNSPSANDFFSFNSTGITEEGNYQFKSLDAGIVTDYCLENTAIANEQYTDKTTGVIYKAVATWNDQAAATFYVYKQTIHFAFADVKAIYEADNKGTTLTDGTIAELAAKGITKYVNGECYYRVMIKHEPSDVYLDKMEFGVVRNNVYKLNVRSVKGLGEPSIPTSPDPDEPDPTLAEMILDVTVAKWTIRTNDFDL